MVFKNFNHPFDVLRKGTMMKKKPKFDETFEFLGRCGSREAIEKAIDRRLVTGEPESLKEWMGDRCFDFCSVTQIEVSASGKPLYVWETPGANVCSFATRRGVLVNGQVMKYRGKKTLYSTSDVWIGYFKQFGNYNLLFFKKEVAG